jgi:hypothetical protein
MTDAEKRLSYLAPWALPNKSIVMPDTTLQIGSMFMEFLGVNRPVSGAAVGAEETQVMGRGTVGEDSLARCKGVWLI